MQVIPLLPFLLKQGIPLKVVSERLGHSSISITADIYSHVTPGMQESAAKLFDDAISTKYNEIEKYVTIP
jgi:integrase